VSLFTAGFPMPDAVYAQAKDDDCQALDTGPIPNPAQAACDVGEAVIDKGPVGAAQDAVAAPVKAAGDEVMKGITNWVGNGASWLVGQAGKLIDETTTPRIESPWFLRQYGTMGALAAVFALPLLLLSVLQSLMRRDAGQLTRSAFVHLPLAFAFTATAVTIVQLALQLTDAMSAQVASSVARTPRSSSRTPARASAPCWPPRVATPCRCSPCSWARWSRPPGRSSSGSSCSCAPRRSTSRCCFCPSRSSR